MKIYFYFLLVVLLFSCSKKHSGSEYLPECGVGSEYIYTLELLSIAGKQTGQLISRVESSEEISGINYNKIVNIYSGIPGLENEIFFIRYTPEGIYRLEKSTNSKEQILYPFPLLINTTWNFKDREGYKYECTVTSNEDLYLPEKTYKNCLKITWNGKKSYNEVEGLEYLAPGIGVVKSVWKYSGVVMEMVLVKDNCK